MGLAQFAFPFTVLGQCVRPDQPSHISLRRNELRRPPVRPPPPPLDELAFSAEVSHLHPHFPTE